MRSGPVLRRVFDKRHRALDKHLAKALEGDCNAVHQARVATRRLREALPVVGAGRPQKPVNKLRRHMRKLGRLLGGVRERDVAIGMLEQHQAEGMVAAPASGRVRVSLEHAREEARTILTDSLDEQKIARWMQELETFATALDDPQAPDAAAWRIVLARRLLKRTEILRVAINDAGMLFVSERLHAVRIGMKRVRYAVELAAELGGRKLDSMLEDLKAGQDTLGELHDIDILMGYVNSAMENAPPVPVTPTAPADQSLHASLDALLTKLEAERHELHAKYLTHQPHLLALVDRIQDHIVPRFTMARATAPRPMARRKPASSGGAAAL